MTAYAPASALGWLDLDAAASERVGVLLRSLEEPTTLDALGLGVVRDAFSWVLSPGTSTIQTRVRYFVFLPWIFARLEDQRVAPADFAQRLRDAEAQLIDCLRHIGPNQGVIGFTAGRTLKRLPSEIYWGGLGTWGLRRLDLSLAEYGKRASALGRLRPQRDDDGNVTSRPLSMWAPLPDPPEDFLRSEASFDLSADEAGVLVDHIRQRYPGSLLGAMCGQPKGILDVPEPWDLLARTTLPSALVDALNHARCFSEVTIGPQHVYNVLLARSARHELGWDTAELEARELERTADWVRLIEDRHDVLRAWADDRADFWNLVDGLASVSAVTRRFIDDIVDRAVHDPAGFAEDPAVHALVRDREIRLKGKRARLVNRTALETWNQAPFGGQLLYRWQITRSYLIDIADGLEARA